MGFLKVGASTIDITPPAGIDLSGYIRRTGPSTGVHDPLQANILWLDDGAECLLMISLDVLMMDEKYCSNVKTAISGELNILPDNIIVAAIHTHSAPGMHFFRNGARRDLHWESDVFQSLLKGVVPAVQNAKKASMGFGLGNTEIGVNRRQKKGPVDSRLPIVYFCGEDGNPIAAIAVYGCHPVVLNEQNRLISADYVGFFRKFLNEHFGSDFPVLFFTGAAGDVDPAERGNFSAAERCGRILADEAASCFQRMMDFSHVDIGVFSTSVQLSYDGIPSVQESKQRLRSAWKKYDMAKNRGSFEQQKIKGAFVLWAEEIYNMALNCDLPHFIEAQMQCVRIGPVLFLASPFELFATTSLALNKILMAQNICPVGYANGYAGYLPDSKSAKEEGYEVDEAYKYTGMLPLSSESEGIFLDAALKMVSHFI